ncbi:MAG: hypothetical protein OEO19_18330 [Gammaproteobacteria bacterium]|nr:hypothetical protein [Gammaproteobacteria bacterium]MDH3449568.1 hypothetical protein [Gammaproteobacteria bacterium]
MNLFWVIPITAASVVAGTSLCFYLLFQARGVAASLWLLEHILCPIIRIIVLLVVVSQIYPSIDANSTSVDFWRILFRHGQGSDLINILFFAGLLLAFIPIVDHPVFALSMQSLLTIALVFRWQYLEYLSTLLLFPSAATLAKIVAYMTLAYFVTTRASIPISRWIDHRLAISGSIRPTSDAIYMLLQIPVMLIYCSFLGSQLARAG